MSAAPLLLCKRFDYRGDMVVAAGATRMSPETQSAPRRAGHLSRQRRRVSQNLWDSRV